MPKPAAPRHGEPIRLTLTKSGEPRYRVVLDADPDPTTGRRRQVRSTHRSLTAARKHVAEHRTDRGRGTLLDRSKVTFAEYGAQWLAGRSQHVRTVTTKSYAGCLRTGEQAFGSKVLAQITRAHVEALIADLAARGRSQRTVSLLLFVLRSVFEQAREEGLIARNPASRVKPAGAPKREREALSGTDLSRLRAHLADDPLYACWLLTLYGLRRSEVMALTWAQVDLTEGVVRVEGGRLKGTRDTAVTPPKTRRGRRLLPITGELGEALRALREQQAADFGFAHVRTGPLAVDAVGRALPPAAWSERWRRACKAAGVPSLTLHSARHSSVTAMRNAGVPDHIVAAFHGHDEYVMRATYSHADQDGLAKAAETLSAVLGGTP